MLYFVYKRKPAEKLLIIKKTYLKPARLHCKNEYGSINILKKALCPGFMHESTAKVFLCMKSLEGSLFCNKINNSMEDYLWEISLLNSG